MAHKQIAIIGDSLTAGWLPLRKGWIPEPDRWTNRLLTLLKQHYRNEIAISVYAQPGQTIDVPKIDLGFSPQISMNKIDSWASKQEIDLLIIFLGTNDYFTYHTYSQQHHKTLNIPELITVDLKHLHQKFSNTYQKTFKNDFHTLLVVPPMVTTHDQQRFLTDLPDAYEQLAQQNGWSCLNLQAIINPKAEDFKNYDGVHYVAADSAQLSNVFYQKIMHIFS